MCDELDEGLPQLLRELQPRADDVRQREEREEQADPEDLQSKGSESMPSRKQIFLNRLMVSL